MTTQPRTPHPSRNVIRSKNGDRVSTSSNPQVSVLTPSFNQGVWLGDNLASVHAQTYTNIEHIVVDNRSTDSSVEVLRSTSWPITWISEKDRGQSHAINRAFAMSSGDIIGWLNSDDAYFSTGAVQAAVDALELAPEAALAYGHSAVVDGKNRLLHFKWAPPYSRRIFRFHNFISQPATFVRRSAVADKLVDERYEYSMDRELWLRLTRQYEAIRVPVVLAIDRHHSMRKSYTRHDLFLHDLRHLVQEYHVPPDGKRRIPLKMTKMACRIAGARLALDPRVVQSLACDLAVSNSTTLLLRQIAFPRNLM
jgi:glycosyltransferase involved in cell wall biosynthesis